jgi:hypothetical protein
MTGRFATENKPVHVVQETAWGHGPVRMGTKFSPSWGLDPRTAQSIASRCPGKHGVLFKVFKRRKADLKVCGTKSVKGNPPSASLYYYLR